MARRFYDEVWARMELARLKDDDLEVHRYSSGVDIVTPSGSPGPGISNVTLLDSLPVTRNRTLHLPDL